MLGIENEITFSNWMLFNVPPMLINVILAWIFVYFVYVRNAIKEGTPQQQKELRDSIKIKYDLLGPLTYVCALNNVPPSNLNCNSMLSLNRTAFYILVLLKLWLWFCSQSWSFCGSSGIPNSWLDGAKILMRGTWTSLRLKPEEKFCCDFLDSFLVSLAVVNSFMMELQPFWSWYCSSWYPHAASNATSSHC